MRPFGVSLPPPELFLYVRSAGAFGSRPAVTGPSSCAKLLVFFHFVFFASIVVCCSFLFFWEDQRQQWQRPPFLCAPAAFTTALNLLLLRLLLRLLWSCEQHKEYGQEEKNEDDDQRPRNLASDWAAGDGWKARRGGRCWEWMPRTCKDLQGQSSRQGEEATKAGSP